MFDFFHRLLDISDFMPHGQSFRWQTDILWIHVMGDLLTAMAFIFISIGLWIIAQKGKELKYRGMLILFATFIFLCGLTQAISLWTLWVPAYGLESLLKLATGLASITGAFVLIKRVPPILKFPSYSEMEAAKQAAEQAAVAKQEFLSVMTHEIRTPINAIMGMTNLLLEGKLSQEQQGYAETIRLSGSNLLTIVNEILDFSKMNLGNLELEKQWVDSSEPIDTTINLLAEQAKRKNLELIYFIDPHTPYNILTDLTLLNQILINLISNAIKFTKQGEVEITMETVGMEEGEYILQFEIRDTGIGIPADKMDRLFKHFSQVDTSLSRSYGGTGLGLAISKKLVQTLGGEIWVESEEGVGTSFYFTIKAAGHAPMKEVYAQTIFAEKKILLLDDNQAQVDVMKKICESWGLAPVGTTDPEKALNILRSQSDIEVMVVDYDMPSINGMELSKEIRKRFPQKPLSILLLSSVGMQWDPQKQGYADDYLPKPFKYKAFKEKLEVLFDQRKMRKQSRKEEGESSSLSALLGPLKILVVEDNLINQKVALKQLSKLGYEADLASNGVEAIKAWELIPYDLILMDLQMPEMDGITATVEIRKRQYRTDIKPVIIALTANTTMEAQDNCFRVGMNDFLTKPVQKEKFVEVLKKWFEGTVHTMADPMIPRGQAQGTQG